MNNVVCASVLTGDTMNAVPYLIIGIIALIIIIAIVVFIVMKSNKKFDEIIDDTADSDTQEIDDTADSDTQEIDNTDDENDSEK